jgi:bifunctional UDP-N-acetylglucosamine pyrophosphorylase/glucosamine-1-phosphate N-acetyltransferase
MTELLSIILAAGEGTRMRSAMPKVLHAIGGLPMVSHTIRAARAAGAGEVAVVIGPNHDDIRAAIAREAPAATVIEQTYRLGTGHAVREAREAFADAQGNVVVLYGDTPLVTSSTIASITAKLDAAADLVVVGFEPENPTGYGRLLTAGNQLLAIREHKDATEEERAVRLCNSGIMGFKAAALRAVIDRIENKNAKGEFYLTDAVELANVDDLEVEFTVVDAREVIGVDDRAKLALAEGYFQERRRQEHMASGVTLIDPSTVYFSWDTRIARDVVIEPSVVFGAGVAIGEGTVIHAFSHIEGATIGAGASVGPFARLRPEANLDDGAKVGNFVEIKKARIGKGAKVSHLTYIGDADVGSKANIGAGTVTCNYDGVNKARTVIGANAFIGSNSSLVAPVTIGEGAYIGSGSVITRNVEPDALALGRGRQENKLGYASKLRARAEAIKRAKSKE